MSVFKEKIVASSEIKTKTILSLLFLFIFLGACVGGWYWLHKQPRDNEVYKPLRTVLNTNENIFTYFFSNSHRAKIFPLKEAVPKVRVNGDAGLSDDFDLSAWKLQVVRKPGDTLLVTMNEILALPKIEIVFDFKCIEGWSQVTRWGGVKFSDFMKKYGLDEQSSMNYVSLQTPDREYYVGIDRQSMMHPQTILCYEMNGQPLPLNQGAPLRLIIPVKYGVKHLKRIGTISFSNERPPDYWYERGYDYYCGL